MLHVHPAPTTGTGRAIDTLVPSADAIERLRPLLRAAADLDLDDREGWARLRRAARVTLATLIQGDRLPAHLAIEERDAPVTVQRTIASAWRHATSAPEQRPVRRPLIGRLAR